MSKLKVVMTRHGRGEVWLDGHKLPNVQSVNLDMRAGDANTATVKVYMPEVEVTGPFKTNLDSTCLFAQYKVVVDQCRRAALRQARVGFVGIGAHLYWKHREQALFKTVLELSDELVASVASMLWGTE